MSENENTALDVYTRCHAQIVNAIEQGWARGACPGIRRASLTSHSFQVVYQPDVKPIRIMAVLRGRRNIRRILQERI